MLEYNPLRNFQHSRWKLLRVVNLIGGEMFSRSSCFRCRSSGKGFQVKKGFQMRQRTFHISKVILLNVNGMSGHRQIEICGSSFSSSLWRSPKGERLNLKSGGLLNPAAFCGTRIRGFVEFFFPLW